LTTEEKLQMMSSLSYENKNVELLLTFSKFDSSRKFGSKPLLVQNGALEKKIKFIALCVYSKCGPRRNLSLRSLP
jgi:hypothetical protein